MHACRSTLEDPTTNTTGHVIDILGYLGEAQYQLRPDGVWQNQRSPSVNAATATPATPTGPAGSSDWQRIATAPLLRWHDHRAHWTGSPPPQVAADPAHTRRVLDWVIPLREDTGRTITVRGSVDWIPPPEPGSWWALTLLAAMAIATLGALPARPGRYALAAVALVGAVAAISYAVAAAADTAAPGPGGLARELALGHAWPLLTAAGMLAAVARVLARRPAADFTLALAGTCLTVMAGLTNASAFTYATAPATLDGYQARLAVATVIAAGAGLTAAAILRLRRTTPTREPAQPDALADAAADDR